MILRIKIAKKDVRQDIRVATVILSLLVIPPVQLSSLSIYVPIFKEKQLMPRIVEDWQWVAMTALQEAKFESFKGMVMVCEVIRDRTEAKYNSDGTIPGTILSPKQFSGWNAEGKLRINIANLDLSDEYVAKAIKAYNMAFVGRTNYAMGANLYHADYLNPYPEWTKSEKVVRLTQEGHHIFYKETR